MACLNHSRSKHLWNPDFRVHHYKYWGKLYKPEEIKAGSSDWHSRRLCLPVEDRLACPQRRGDRVYFAYLSGYSGAYIRAPSWFT